MKALYSASVSLRNSDGLIPVAKQKLAIRSRDSFTLALLGLQDTPSPS